MRGRGTRTRQRSNVPGPPSRNGATGIRDRDVSLIVLVRDLWDVPGAVGCPRPTGGRHGDRRAGPRGRTSTRITGRDWDQYRDNGTGTSTGITGRDRDQLWDNGTGNSTGITGRDWDQYRDNGTGTSTGITGRDWDQYRDNGAGSSEPGSRPGYRHGTGTGAGQWDGAGGGTSAALREPGAGDGGWHWDDGMEPGTSTRREERGLCPRGDNGDIDPPRAAHAGRPPPPPPMADREESPRRAPTHAGTQGPGTQPCRAVPRVHAFGKGEQALRRDPQDPPILRGWLLKQDSSGLRLWKRRWFVLVDLCLYYYLDSSEQRVRGGLPLPGYEIRILPRTARAPRFLFTAEHPGMRTYCLGAETPTERSEWVRALRQGAAALPRSPLSLQTPEEPETTGPPTPPLPSPPLGEEPGHPPTPPPLRVPVPPLPSSKEVAPAQMGSGGPEQSQGTARGPPVPAATAAGRSQLKPRLPGAASPQRRAGSGPDAAERDVTANQTLRSPPGSPDWLLAPEASDRDAPSRGTASTLSANETSPLRRAGEVGRGWEREGAAGRGARRPIRITLLQASF
ncbi:pleckstrin homology domain-containing family A member 4 [Melanerpes formicivorus]|uniref:pleckstrin homology domain-containing family A member 4 n=1 Tax=Melanerpes formicivorus TaxID=211600 RepID=UPI00358F1960